MQTYAQAKVSFDCPTSLWCCYMSVCSIMPKVGEHNQYCTVPKAEREEIPPPLRSLGLSLGHVLLGLAICMRDVAVCCHQLPSDFAHFSVKMQLPCLVFPVFRHTSGGAPE